MGDAPLQMFSNMFNIFEQHPHMQPTFNSEEMSQTTDKIALKTTLSGGS